jgi:hypothetical protein
VVVVGNPLQQVGILECIEEALTLGPKCISVVGRAKVGLETAGIIRRIRDSEAGSGKE